MFMGIRRFFFPVINNIWYVRAGNPLVVVAGLRPRCLPCQLYNKWTPNRYRPFHTDTLTLANNPNTTLTSQNFNYQFRSTFATTPALALGTFTLIQHFRTSLPQWLLPILLQYIPLMSPHLLLFFNSTILLGAGTAFDLTSGPVVILKFNLDFSN